MISRFSKNSFWLLFYDARSIMEFKFNKWWIDKHWIRNAYARVRMNEERVFLRAFGNVATIEGQSP